MTLQGCVLLNSTYKMKQRLLNISKRKNHQITLTIIAMTDSNLMACKTINIISYR